MTAALKNVWCGKINYPTRAEAERACRAIQDRTSQSGARVYHCRTCDAFHFGHLRDNAQKKTFVPRNHDSEEQMLTTIEKGKTVAPTKINTAAIAEAQVNRELSWLAQRIAKSQDGVVCEIATITPTIAQHILDKNPDNRSVKSRLVTQIANDIKSGMWQLNGEAIIIAKSGELNDGQHRLNAIIEAKKPVQTLLIFGVERVSRYTVDMGIARSAADFLGMESVKYRAAAAAAAKLLISYRMGQYAPSEEIITRQVVREEYWKRRKRIDAATTDLCSDKLTPMIGAAALVAAHVVLHDANSEQASVFFMKLLSGENLKRNDPILALRSRIFVLKQERLRPHHKLELLMRYWNAWRANQSVSRAIALRNEYPQLSR